MGRSSTSQRRFAGVSARPCKRSTNRCIPVLSRALILACVWVMLVTGSQVSAVSPVQVLSSDDGGVRFSVTGLEPVWQEHGFRGDDLVLYEARIPGFVSQGGPAEPMLPRHGGWVIVPPGRWPELVVHEEQWVTSEPRRLMVTPTPIMFEDPETGEPILGEELLLPGEKPTQGVAVDDGSRSVESLDQAKISGGAAVILGEVQIWRGRRIVSYSVTPLRVDEAGQASQYLRSGTWEIRFVAEKRGGGDADATFRFEKETRHGDDSFGTIFLNGDKLSHWRTEAAAGSAYQSLSGASAIATSARSALKRGSLLAPEVRMIVGRTRLHRVMASELQDENLFPGTPIQEDQVRVYQRRYLEDLDAAGTTPPYVEIEVPIHMVGEGDEFAGDDFFLFYGLLPRDDGSFTTDFGAGPVDIPDCGDTPENYNGRNVYWLAASEPDLGESWSRMEVATLGPASGPARSSYRRLESYEENNSFSERSELVSGIPVDQEYHSRNYWNSLNDSDISARIRLYSPDFSANDVTLRVSCVGASNSSTTRWVEVYFDNGSVDSLLATINVNTLARVNYVSTLTGDLLTDGDVIVHLQRPGGTQDMWSYLDWVELEYDGRYHVRDDTLLFHCGDATSDQDVEVTGFRTDDLGLIEISDPRQPVWIDLAPANIVDAGGSYALSLHVPQPDGRRTFYTDSEMSGDGVSEIVYYRSGIASGDDPTAVAEPPDLIVVTHAEFEQTIDRWVEHRRAFAGGDLSVHVVDVRDLYDYYSGGLVSPWAIKRFATHALNEWGSWALQIVGDANENARGFGSANSSDLYYNDPTDWVPTKLHVQYIGGYPPEYMA
ncbi:MAG: C25 family cysteine peptidase, partial [bacterium]